MIISLFVICIFPDPDEEMIKSNIYFINYIEIFANPEKQCYYILVRLLLHYYLMKTDIASSREYIARRGHMVAFLLCALSVTGWINNFQVEINEANIAFMDQV